MLMLEINGRFDTKSSMYFDICRESYEEFTKYDAEVKARMKVGSGFLSGLIIPAKQRNQYWVKAVVFGALCLEAFIYDYAAHNFTDKYARQYLDNLDFISKWVVIPKLVTGNDFPREGQAFEHLRKLVKARNDLVHAKSRRIPSNDKEWQRLIKSTEKKEGFADLNPCQTIVEALTELRNLGDEGVATKWWELVKVDEQK